MSRGRFLDDDHELVDPARWWITGIESQFRSVPPPSEVPAPVEPGTTPGGWGSRGFAEGEHVAVLPEGEPANERG